MRLLTKSGSLLAPAVAALLLGACADSPQQSADKPKVDVAQVEAAIRATDAQWKAAVKARDVEKTAGFWSDDAVLMPPDSAPIKGKKAIHDYVAEAFKSPDFSVRWELGKTEVAASGDLAYSTGHDWFTFRDPKKKVVTQEGNSCVVWKKQADDSWKAVVDIWTPGTK